MVNLFLVLLQEVSCLSCGWEFIWDAAHSVPLQQHLLFSLLPSFRGQECRVDTARAPVEIVGPAFNPWQVSPLKTGPRSCALWGLPSDVFSHARQRNVIRIL